MKGYPGSRLGKALGVRARGAGRAARAHRTNHLPAHLGFRKEKGLPGTGELFHGNSQPAGLLRGGSGTSFHLLKDQEEFFLLIPGSSTAAWRVKPAECQC